MRTIVGGMRALLAMVTLSLAPMPAEAQARSRSAEGVTRLG